jgi:hypothetical protein
MSCGPTAVDPLNRSAVAETSPARVALRQTHVLSVARLVSCARVMSRLMLRPLAPLYPPFRAHLGTAVLLSRERTRASGPAQSDAAGAP